MLRTLLMGLCATLLVVACVKPKIYKAEQTLRVKSEARETVLVKELLDRKAETAKLTELVGNLNRSLGKQEAELGDLRTELASRTQQMGESSSKLVTEKMALEKQVGLLQDELEKRKETLRKIREAQEKGKNQLGALHTALIKAYEKSDGAVISRDNETVQLILNDKFLFEATGVALSASGKNLLAPLAAFLSERPDLDVDIICYTDNALPKGDKTLKDTWDWSLQRATGITRLLIREFNVNANQLTPVGRGEFYPLTSNETAEGRQKNRRTVVVMRPVLPVLPAAE